MRREGTGRRAVGSDFVGVARSRGLDALTREISECRACPRLVSWREQIAREKRASYRDDTYWARPVPGFGDPGARVLVLGLAPAAHGGNRTGRVFTGDRSGDFLFASMFRCGFANQPTSVAVDDGLVLRDAYVAAAVRCAPPANKPTTAERDECAPFLQREVALLGSAAGDRGAGRVRVRGRCGRRCALGAAGCRCSPAGAHGSRISSKFRAEA